MHSLGEHVETIDQTDKMADLEIPKDQLLQ